MDISPPSPIYVCVVCGGGTRHRGEYFGFLVAILDFVAQKNATRPLRMPIGLAHHGPGSAGLGA